VAAAIAIDVAILPPPEIAALAVALNLPLAAASPDSLRLDDRHLPHITLTQQFVAADGLQPVIGAVDDVVRGEGPLTLQIAGAALQGDSVWLTLGPSERLQSLHARLMHALHPLEVRGGAAAFFEGRARDRDVEWVGGYRTTAAHALFRPHITIGRGAPPRDVRPASFPADAIALCQLGRFCTCRHVIRSWTLAS